MTEHGRRLCLAVLLASGLALFGSSCRPAAALPAPPPSAPPVSVRAAFGRDCEHLVVREIEKADGEILAAVFSLTRRNIASALNRAARRGVRVAVKYDAKQADYEGMKQALGILKDPGIRKEAVAMTDEAASMHHKFLVVDRRRVITGSYNFTTAASEKNYENVVAIESADVALEFVAEFDQIRSR